MLGVRRRQLWMQQTCHLEEISRQSGADWNEKTAAENVRLAMLELFVWLATSKIKHRQPSMFEFTCLCHQKIQACKKALFRFTCACHLEICSMHAM